MREQGLLTADGTSGGRAPILRWMADDQRQSETTGIDLLPPRFAAWFGMRGWSLRPHQAGLIAAARQGQGGLVNAPTGGGETWPLYTLDVAEKMSKRERGGFRRCVQNIAFREESRSY